MVASNKQMLKLTSPVIKKTPEREIKTIKVNKFNQIKQDRKRSKEVIIIRIIYSMDKIKMKVINPVHRCKV